MVAYVYFSVEFARTLVVELGLPKIPLRKSQLMMKYILRDLKSQEAALRWEKRRLKYFVHDGKSTSSMLFENTGIILH